MKVKRQTDNALAKAVYIDGNKWGGVQNVSLEYDVDKVLTRVHLTFVVRNNGIKITRKRLDISPLVKR